MSNQSPITGFLPRPVGPYRATYTAVQPWAYTRRSASNLLSTQRRFELDSKILTTRALGGTDGVPGHVGGRGRGRFWFVGDDSKIRLHRFPPAPAEPGAGGVRHCGSRAPRAHPQ